MTARALLSRPVRVLLTALALFVVCGASSLPGASQARPASSYTVTRTANGVRITLRFAQSAYPKQGLIAVTVTLRNLSHQRLAVNRERLPYGLCRWPGVSLTSVDAAGQSVEPAPVIPPPFPPCAAPTPVNLPRGRTIVEHQLVELWSPRLAASARAYDRVQGGYNGFSVPGPTAALRLQPVTVSTIRIGSDQGVVTATLSPQPDAQAPLYYRSWGTCTHSQVRPLAVYWTRLQSPVLSSGCTPPLQWHVDMGMLNGPVATLELKE